MTHFCIYTKDPQFATVLTQLRNHNIPFEAHVNRTRFHIDPSHTLYSYFALLCTNIDHETNHALGV